MSRNTITVVLSDGTEAFWVLDEDSTTDEVLEMLETKIGSPDSIRL